MTITSNGCQFTSLSVSATPGFTIDPHNCAAADDDVLVGYSCMPA